MDLLLFVCVFPILHCLCFAALGSPAVKTDLLALLYVTFVVFLSLSDMVSWIRSGILYIF